MVVLGVILLCHRRLADDALGRLLPRGFRAARHLAGQFRHAHVGRAAGLPRATIRATTGGSPLLTFGEGWHNNHHAHPTSIRHGLAWYEIDHSWILVNILKRIGLVSDLKVAKLDTRLAEREAA